MIKVIFSLVNPLTHGEGLCTPPPLPWFFAHYSKHHTILENSWPCKTFCCGCTYKKMKNSTLKYWSKNRPCVRGLTLLLPSVFGSKGLCKLLGSIFEHSLFFPYTWSSSRRKTSLNFYKTLQAIKFEDIAIKKKSTCQIDPRPVGSSYPILKSIDSIVKYYAAL